MSNTDFNFTDDELEALSDEEKEALGIEIDAENGGQSEDDDDLESNETKPVPEVVEPEIVEEIPVVQQTEQQPNLVESYKAVTEAIEALGVEMEDGDIGFAEYNKRLNELIGQKTRIEILYENEQQAQVKASNDWNTAQDKFFSDPAHAVIKEKSLLYNAMGAAVADVSNSKEAQGKSYDWILQQAKALVESELGVSLSGAKQTAQPQKKALNSVELPKTLGNIPASQANDSGNEFAHLDRMNNSQREAALLKMKPEEMNRYLEQG